ncbi:MAG: hypothetical protein AB8F94_08835 [Saprospiraceae bacterium]
MKKFILRSITFLSIINLTLFFNSCKEDITDIKIPTIQKEVEFDKHLITVTGNAQVSIIDNEVVIENLGEPQEEFSFYVKPLTDEYWINILFNNLIIDQNVKLIESNYTRQKDSGEKSLVAKTSYDMEKMQMENRMIGGSANLLVANSSGGWENPIEDITIDSVQSIYPIVAGIIGGLGSAAGFILNKISYKEVVVNDAAGNPHVLGLKDWGCGCGIKDPNTGEKYGDLDKQNAFELSQTTLNTSNVVPVVIDGTQVTCTGLPFIKIGKILNGRAPL